jgi:predicted dehydrogenase
MSKSQFKVAIIGTGGIAKAHVNGLRELKDRATIVAGVDVDRGRVEQFCAEQQIPKAYTDTTKMLAAEKPDLVHIATPPGTHCDLSIECLESGPWVLCEKPLCGSFAELDRIEEAEKRTGRYVSSVFQWRFGSGGKHLKRLVDAQALGKPTVGLCSTTWYRDAEYYAVPWRGKWSTELGGATMTQGIHAMDFFLWVFGDWTEVRAMTTTLDRKIEVEDISMAIVKFASGAMASIVNSVLCPRQETLLRLDFQKATVEMRALYAYRNADWRFTPIKGLEHEVEKWQAIGDEVPSSHGTQTAALLDCMEKNQRPLVSGKEARRTIEFISCMYKSASTGCAVRAGSITKDDRFYHHVAGYAKP